MEALSTPSITLPTESSLKECNPRLAQYKSKNLPNQEERRQSLLEQQKKNRDESFNASRGLIEELVTSEQDAMEWTSSKFKPRIQKLYTNRLMFSEWLKQVREICHKCGIWYPVQLVAGPWLLHQEVRLVHTLRLEFKQQHLTLLFLVPMLDCETEFRFFWLKSKLGEMPSLSEKSDDNPYPFILLEYHSCDQSVMTNVMAIEHLFGENGPALDGLLFYHSQTHYIPGSTPLVGWLKPHMMPAVLGVDVAPVYLQQETMETDRKNTRRLRRRNRRNKDKSVEGILYSDSLTEKRQNTKYEMEDDDMVSAGDMEINDTDGSSNT
ncbi:hypothetical protein L9F63_027957 [Diploptera punctata]|uniref:Snurportin-1 n=1 Tax=Diploptera punctata TaxID=6984 RepID=A0AAD8EHH9_DIPPU|nr:hypothetical protein L9F63_027957 [Diploptera punctata]